MVPHKFSPPPLPLLQFITNISHFIIWMQEICCPSNFQPVGMEDNFKQISRDWIEPQEQVTTRLLSMIFSPVIYLAITALRHLSQNKLGIIWGKCYHALQE